MNEIGRVFALIGLLSIASQLFGQDTIYYSGKDRVEKAKADRYVVVAKKTNHEFVVKRYTINGVLQEIGHYAKYGPSKKEQVKEGNTTTYYTNGAVYSSVEFKKGKREGKLVSYYPNGKIKREEIFQSNKWISGKLFAEDGKELPYTPFEMLPQFPGGVEELSKIIVHHLEYPKGCTAEGRVILGFVIDKDGTMINPKVVQSANPILSDAALKLFKAIASIYKWQPGMQDGRPVQAFYTIPITYRLP